MKTKKCIKCGKIFPSTSEYFYPRWYKLPNSLRNECKNCKKKLSIESHKRKTNFNKIFFKQKNRCAICGRKPRNNEKTFDIDHNHQSGKTRGIVCNFCNCILAFAKDNPLILIKAIEYLLNDKKSHRNG